MEKILAIAAAVFLGLANLPYWWAIIRGKGKPVRASWLIWATLDTITFSGMYAAGTLTPQVATAAFGVWVIFALSLWRGRPGWTRVDKLCLLGAAIGILLWQYFDDPALAIVTSQFTAQIGCIPTYLSAWEDPSRESRFAWTLTWTSSVFAILAIPQWTIEDATAPLSFFLNSSTMLFIFAIRARQKRAQREKGLTVPFNG